MTPSNFKKIIPCLDMKDDRVVKGIKFEDIAEVGDPVTLAKRYQEEGADELAALDIGSADRSVFLETIGSIAKELTIPFCVGGGIKSLSDAEEVLKAGATKISVCSSALDRPELLSELSQALGKEKVVLAIDAKRVAGSKPTEWHAYAGGGRKDTGLDAIAWAKQGEALGAGEIMLNSIDGDGTNEGYDIALCKAVSGAVSIPVIASGGAGSLEQIGEVLTKTGVASALVASLLHYGKVRVSDIRSYLQAQGLRS